MKRRFQLPSDVAKDHETGAAPRTLFFDPNTFEFIVAVKNRFRRSVRIRFREFAELNLGEWQEQARRD